MSEFESTETTLSTGADSSAASTGTSTTDTSTGDMKDVSSWRDALEWKTAEHDTPPEGQNLTESAAVAKEGAETKQEDPAGEQTPAEKDLPWHNDPRWKAWQEEKALLEQAKPLIEPLLQQFGGIEGINAELARQAQEAEAAQQRDIERQDQAAIEQRLQAQLQTGDLDETAYQQALHYEVANARLYRVEMAGAVQTAATQFPDMDRDLVAAFAADPDMVKVIAQHTHSRVAEIKGQHAQQIQSLRDEMKTAGERAVAEYVAANKDRLQQPPPEGGSGNGPGGPIDRANLGSWGKIIGGLGRRV